MPFYGKVMGDHGTCFRVKLAAFFPVLHVTPLLLPIRCLTVHLKI